jgi:hypothetical protein
VYFWLANAVMGIHLLTIFILVAGLGATVTGKYSRYPSFFWITYAAAWIGVLLSHVLLQDCFLTLWEKRLWDRHVAGSAYHGTFFDNYFPFLSSFINRYGLGIILTGAFIQVALWLLARKVPKRHAA